MPQWSDIKVSSRYGIFNPGKPTPGFSSTPIDRHNPTLNQFFPAIFVQWRCFARLIAIALRV
ncbi:hypothetical protein [Nostoc sp. DedQUE04]|uniref:hypothetical protein n=1 Tax=Nostoc sp. DedQUE04 TaxID=3075390 RepID=UPI002AD4F01C|nr:hypothetical protein [Nostoc sp. DedQUE04]